MAVLIPRRKKKFWVYVTCVCLIFLVAPRMFGVSRHKVHFSDTDDLLYYRQQRFLKYQLSEPNRTGPGEQGQGVRLEPGERNNYNELYKKEGMNIIASDKIALDRALRDVRSSACKAVTYPKELPTASVIIIYHNEAWSPILRTVHSVVNRSPPEYLKEVILLDDVSNRPELLEPLTEYIRETWPDGIVRQVRTPERAGLIRARQIGAEAAKGDVLIFLDAHCEAAAGWIEPILARIKEDHRAVLCPMIGMIGAEELRFSSGGGSAVGGFSWSGHFTWWYRGGRTRSSTEPYPSPTMAGGLLAIDKDYFFHLGGYDLGMEIWGGENLEMSFRIWQCGGSLEFVPCSHVGHIFRSTHPYGFPDKKRDYHGLNTARLAEVWMDEYKSVFYSFRPDLVTAKYGDVSERKTLRDKLQCKSFKWYLENVYPEKFVYHENVYGWGKFRNPSTNKCFDTYSQDEKSSIKLGLYYCAGQLTGNQLFALSKRDELRRENGCADLHKPQPNQIIFLKHCHGSAGHQQWLYDKTTQELKNPTYNYCVDAVGTTQPNKKGHWAVANPCTGADTQKWEIQNYVG